MKRGPGVLLLTVLSGCSFGGVDFTKPSAAFDLTGAYTLAIQAAPECDLPVQRFEWPVEGVRGSGAGNALIMTLPGDDRRIHLVFCSTCEPDPQNVLGDLDTDGPPVGDAPVPGGLKLLANVSLSGRVTIAPGGRAQVDGGPAEGTLALSREEDEDKDTLGECLSEGNSWSLTPR